MNIFSIIFFLSMDSFNHTVTVMLFLKFKNALNG